MDFGEFREFGHASIEFIINYLSSIRERCVCVCFVAVCVILFKQFVTSTEMCYPTCCLTMSSISCLGKYQSNPSTGDKYSKIWNILSYPD